MAKKPSQLKTLANKYIAEFLQCRASFDYFVRNYVYIELPGNDVLLSPYEKQTELIDLIERDKYILVLKSRQIGISTIIQAYSAWLAIFFDNVVIGIISKDGAEATDFARVIRGMVEKLPEWMKPPGGLLGRGFAKRTERSFILTNGSKVYASPVNPNAPDKTLRGKAITFLVIDEAAFVHYISSAWTSMVPALSTNQMQARKAGIPYGTIVLSTPNKTVGIGQWYFERYMKSISGSDIFKPFVIHWKMIRELAEDPSWYKTQCELFDNDPRKIAQELELKFLPTEGSFFEAETVEKMQEACVTPVEKLQLFNGQIWKFADAIRGKYYMIGVDTAPEHGHDKSAITVWDYETLEQVWEFQGKCRVLDFVKVVKVAAATYPGLIIVESNSYGNQVVEHLNASEYSHMLYKEKRGKNTFVPGLSTNAKTRPLMIDALYSYMTEFPESVRSERLALELTGLVSKSSGKVEADTGCTDDIALSAAVCMYVRKYDPPLLIGFDKASAISIDMLDIVDMNSEMPSTNFTNKDIMKHVKKNYEESTGFIDTLSFYKE
ncbi:MAG: hypothetical protein ACFFG0_02005 [Candidatus Thorarchaeota archaeon]